MRSGPRPEELLIAIRAHCLACSGGCKAEAERCRIKTCPLHPYRTVAALGGEKRDRKKDGQVSLFEYMKEAQ